MCSADAQQALEGRRAAVAPRAWNRAAPVARPAQRPGAMSARRPADARGSAARPAQKPSARSARRPADARRSDARPSQRLSARCAQRPVDAVEPESAVQLTCSCCSRCTDEAQSIGRRNPPCAGWESQSRPRRSSRPERTADSRRGGSCPGSMAPRCDNALQQFSEGAEASCEACLESRGLSPEASGRSEVRSKACIATMGLSSEAAESKDAIDTVIQWALESSDDRGCAKIRSEARSEVRCQSSESCSEAAEAQSVVEALAVRPQTGPQTARQSAEASEAQRCIVEVEVTRDSAPLTPLLRWPMSHPAAWAMGRMAAAVVSSGCAHRGRAAGRPH